MGIGFKVQVFLPVGICFCVKSIVFFFSFLCIFPPLQTSSPSLCCSTALPFLHIFIPPSVLYLSPIPQSSSCSSSFFPFAFMLSSHSLPFHSFLTPPTHLSPFFLSSCSLCFPSSLHPLTHVIHLLTSLSPSASSFYQTILPFCI